LELSEKLYYESGIFWSYITLGSSLAVLGNHALALECDYKALELAKKMNSALEIAFANGILSDCFYYLGEFTTSLNYIREVVIIVESSYPDKIYYMWVSMSRIFEGMNQPDSALFYAKKAHQRIM
jgi:tetratricopeptide (TPR) repeat protein